MNFDLSTWKSQWALKSVKKFHFNGLLLSKVYIVWAKEQECRLKGAKAAFQILAKPVFSLLLSNEKPHSETIPELIIPNVKSCEFYRWMLVARKLKNFNVSLT